MKRINYVVLMVVLLTIPFFNTSCSSDNNDHSLSGTSWVSKTNLGDSNNLLITLVFTDDSFAINSLGTYDGYKENESLLGSYSYDGTDIILSANDMSEHGYLESGKLILYYEDGGMTTEMSFSKKEKTSGDLSGTKWLGTDVQNKIDLTLEFGKENFSMIVSNENSAISSSLNGTYIYSNPIVFLIKDGEISIAKIMGDTCSLLDDETGDDLGVYCVKQ